MAQATPAMTPEQALQTVAAVRGYRERLTARAAGMVWMVWGIVLTLAMHAGLLIDFTAADLDSDKLRATSIALGSAGILLTVAAGAVLTNAVWRSFALESDRSHPRWVPFAASLAAVGLFIALAQGLQLAGDAIGLSGWYSPVHILTATGAFLIAFLQRHRVSPTLGYVVGGALVLVAAATFFPVGDSPTMFQFQSRASVFVPLLAYVAVGLAYFRQG